MLSKKNRLTAETDFKEVLSRGKTVQGKIFTLKYLQKGDEASTRIGVVVSKKVSKLAVYRNKARRRLKEALRRNVKNLKPGFMAVFLVKKEVLFSDYRTIEAESSELLYKGELL
jgi:ribonuclease P protein component